MSIALERTDDILKYLGEHKKENQFLCGFSMETQNMVSNSRAKLEKKNLDMIAANNVKEKGCRISGGYQCIDSDYTGGGNVTSAYEQGGCSQSAPG